MSDDEAHEVQGRTKSHGELAVYLAATYGQSILYRVWRPWIEMLARRHTLIRYDGRGSGLSDREGIKFTLDKAIEDLDAVIEAARVERFVWLGISNGAAIAMTYAARHSEPVRHLVLYGAYTRAAAWLEAPRRSSVRRRKRR